MATKKTTATKRNPQDATRKRDVAPVRRRVQALEEKLRQLSKAVKEHAIELTRLKRVVG